MHKACILHALAESEENKMNTARKHVEMTTNRSQSEEEETINIIKKTSTTQQGSRNVHE